LQFHQHIATFRRLSQSTQPVKDPKQSFTLALQDFAKKSKSLFIYFNQPKVVVFLLLKVNIMYAGNVYPCSVYLALLPVCVTPGFYKTQIQTVKAAKLIDFLFLVFIESEKIRE